MAAKLTRLTHKIAIQLHVVADSPETFGYTFQCNDISAVIFNKLRSHLKF
jgi:hypothetical protein